MRENKPHGKTRLWRRSTFFLVCAFVTSIVCVAGYISTGLSQEACRAHCLDYMNRFLWHDLAEQHVVWIPPESSDSRVDQLGRNVSENEIFASISPSWFVIPFVCKMRFFCHGPIAGNAEGDLRFFTLFGRAYLIGSKGWWWPAGAGGRWRTKPWNPTKGRPNTLPGKAFLPESIAKGYLKALEKANGSQQHELWMRFQADISADEQAYRLGQILELAKKEKSGLGAQESVLNYLGETCWHQILWSPVLTYQVAILCRSKDSGLRMEALKAVSTQTGWYRTYLALIFRFLADGDDCLRQTAIRLLPKNQETSLALGEYIRINEKRKTRTASMDLARIRWRAYGEDQGIGKNPIKSKRLMRRIASLWSSRDGESLLEGGRLLAKAVSVPDLSEGLVQLWEYSDASLPPEEAERVKETILHFATTEKGKKSKDSPRLTYLAARAANAHSEELRAVSVSYFSRKRTRFPVMALYFLSDPSEKVRSRALDAIMRPVNQFGARAVLKSYLATNGAKPEDPLVKRVKAYLKDQK